jgi:hypothetical protein
VVVGDQAPGVAVEERLVIHLERVALPPGLSALAHRDQHGNLVIYVSSALDAGRQRSAVVEAIRATRRTSWRAGLPPVGIALVLAARTVLRRAAAALRVRPVAWGAAATATVAGAVTAGVFLASPPARHAPPAAGPTIGPSAAAPAPQQSRPPPARPAHRARTRLVASAGSPAPGQPSPSASPRPAPTPGGGPSPTPAPAPSPAPSPAPTAPAPAPSPSPSGGSGVCVTLLGLKVCLPTVTVKVSA